MIIQWRLTDYMVRSYRMTRNTNVALLVGLLKRSSVDRPLSCLPFPPFKRFTLERLHDACRGLVMRWHPDHHTGEAAKAEATKKLQQINEAYHVVRSLSRRRTYDAGG